MSGATPVLNLQTPPGGQLYANEAGLPQGTQPGQATTYSTWTFSIRADDGVDDLTVGGYAAIRDGVFTAGGVDLPYGRLSVTRYDAATGEVTVAFQLTGAFQSAPGSGPTRYGDIVGFDVTLTDRDGDAAQGKLLLQIRDDEAVQPTSDSLSVAAGAARSGNLVTDGTPDRFTADGFGRVTHIADGRWTTMDYEADTDGRYSITGQYGVLTVSPTGAYTYTAKADAPAGAVDRFDYWVSDGDGDEARASVTVTIQEAPPPPPSTSGGQVYTSPGPGSSVTAGAGDDTINASHGADTLTGGAGHDTFAFAALPWNAGKITDFAVGTDRLDLSKIFAASGYSGSDPIADGRMTLASDGAGGTTVYFDRDAAGSGDWPFQVTTLQGVSASGLTWAQLSGGATGGGGGEPPPPPPSSGEGKVYTSPAPGSTVTAGAGDDTINASQGADTLTGGAGHDSFAFAALPWSAGKITDFAVGTDRLDLSKIFAASGYSGADPIADGRMTLASDGAGGTTVYFDRDAAGSGDWPFQITTLQGVSASGLTWAQLSGGGSGGGGEPPPPPSETEGKVLTATQNGDTLTGGAGADTLNASQGADRLTGGEGDDHFAFAKLVWSAGVVTDFAPGHDRIDLSGLTGAFPNGVIETRAEGDGTAVYFDQDGAGGEWPTHITTLTGVSPDLLGSDWLIR
jgi:Ca2+-binding RTX toxin-like protein